MKAILVTSALAFCAFSAVAAGQQPPPDEPQQEMKRKVPQQTLSAPASGVTQDSPLVAAAKRSGRLGKKPTQVITNDTLSKTGGHFTTTKSQDALPSPPAAGAAGASDAPLTTNNKPGAATAAPANGAAKKADDAKAAKNKENAVKRAVADYMGESVENVNEDPATQEGVVRQGTTPSPAAAPKPASAPAPPARPPSE